MFWLAKFISTVYLFAYLLFLLFLFLPIEELKLFLKKRLPNEKKCCN